MRIHVASTNPAKVRQLTLALAHCGIATFAGTDPSTLPDLEEDAVDAKENARKKAKAFASALQGACLAMDASLFFPDLASAMQPGVNVRRIPGAAARPTDDEVLDYYLALCVGHGGELRAQWVLGFAIGLADGQCVASTANVDRTLVAPACTQRRPGYPLDSLQRDPRTGLKLAELCEAEEALMWQQTIGAPLQTFVVDALHQLEKQSGELL